MSWFVDTSREVGGFVLTALGERRVSGGVCGSALSVTGTKMPHMVVILCSETCVGMDLHGNSCDAAELERRYPGAIEQIKERLKPDTGLPA